MDRFIARANIKFHSARLMTEEDADVRRCLHLLLDRLMTEEDADVRRRLHLLLVEALDRLGADLELIVEIERTISAFDALIERQRKLVMTLQHDGLDGDGRAKALLDGLVESRSVYRNYHRRMLCSLQRAG